MEENLNLFFNLHKINMLYDLFFLGQVDAHMSECAILHGRRAILHDGIASIQSVLPHPKAGQLANVHRHAQGQ